MQSVQRTLNDDSRRQCASSNVPFPSRPDCFCSSSPGPRSPITKKLRFDVPAPCRLGSILTKTKHGHGQFCAGSPITQTIFNIDDNHPGPPAGIMLNDRWVFINLLTASERNHCHDCPNNFNSFSEVPEDVATALASTLPPVVSAVLAPALPSAVSSALATVLPGAMSSACCAPHHDRARRLRSRLWMHSKYAKSAQVPLVSNSFFYTNLDFGLVSFNGHMLSKFELDTYSKRVVLQAESGLSCCVPHGIRLWNNTEQS